MRFVKHNVSSLVKLLASHWVLSLATADRGGRPYATPLFYAALGPDEGPAPGAPLLIFASKPSSTHGTQIGDGPRRVAASVQLETETVGRIHGAQLVGHALRLRLCSGAARDALERVYLRRHPVARALLSGDSDEELYLLVVSWAKLTDNRLGLGKHHIFRFRPAWSKLGIVEPEDPYPL